MDDISKEFESQFDVVFEDHDIKRFFIIDQLGEFSRPGELRFKYDDVNDRPITVLQGNINFDAEVEFEIEVTGHYQFANADLYSWR